MHPQLLHLAATLVALARIRVALMMIPGTFDTARCARQEYQQQKAGLGFLLAHETEHALLQSVRGDGGAARRSPQLQTSSHTCMGSTIMRLQARGGHVVPKIGIHRCGYGVTGTSYAVPRTALSKPHSSARPSRKAFAKSPRLTLSSLLTWSAAMLLSPVAFWSDLITIWVRRENNKKSATHNKGITQPKLPRHPSQCPR